MRAMLLPQPRLEGVLAKRAIERGAAVRRGHKQEIAGRPHDAMAFVDASDVDILGVMNTVAVTLPHLTDGGSVIIIVVTSASTAARFTGSLSA